MPRGSSRLVGISNAREFQIDILDWFQYFPLFTRYNLFSVNVCDLPSKYEQLEIALAGGYCITLLQYSALCQTS